MIRKTSLFRSLNVTVILGMMIGCFGLLPVFAAAPSLINYQGRLRDDSGVAISAVTTVQFSIYNHVTNGAPTDAASEAGALLWKETYDSSSGSCTKVDPDTDGYFTVQLGSCEAFPSYLDFTQSTLYIGVKVSSDSEATPRVRLAAHPYALNTNRIGDFIDTGSSSLRGEALGTATVGVQGYNSPQVLLQGSGWTGAAAANREIKLQNVVTSSSSYRFALSNNDDTELFTVTNGGNVGINDTTPDYTLEVSAASGDAKFALSDPDVAHGVTDVTDTDVFGALVPISSTAGGLTVAGISDTDATALKFTAVVGSADPTDTIAAILLAGTKKSGTSIQALAAAETVFQLDNFTTPLMTVLGSGYVGIGDTTPAAALVVGSDSTAGYANGAGDTYVQNDLEVDHTVYVQGSDTNANGVGIAVLHENVITTNGSYDMPNIYSLPAITIANGVTAGGNGWKGATIATQRSAGAGDQGTLTYLYGASISYGNYATAGTTTNAYGVNIIPVAAQGTIDNAYDLYLASAMTGGTLSNHWAIYQEDATVNNYFAGKIGIGDTTPDYTLEVSAASGDSTLALSDPDVAHGMTDAVQTDVYAYLYPNSSTAGGLSLSGLSDTDAVGLALNGVIGAADPTDTVAAVSVVSAKKNGTTTQALGATETTFQVVNFATPLMTILGGGKVGIGDTSPDYSFEVGTSSGDTTIALSDPDVAHGMTDFFQTDVYAGLYATSSTAGGLTIAGLSDTDANAMKIAGVIGSNDPTDTTPAILLQGVKKNGTSVQVLGATETVLQLTNLNTVLVTALGNGNIGIGDTTPAAALVIGSDSTAGYANGAGDVYIQNDLEVDGVAYLAGDLTSYEAVNNGSPSWFLGSSATERLQIQALYSTGGQAVDRVIFQSSTATATADAGEFRFIVDDATILEIDDNGLEFDVTADRTIGFDSAIAANTDGKSLTISAGPAGARSSAGNGQVGGSMIYTAQPGSAGFQAGNNGGNGGSHTFNLGAGGANGGGGLDVDGTQGTFKIAGTQSNVIANLYNTATAVADTDIGTINFTGKNSTGGMIDYAFISAIPAVVTAGSEDGILDLGVYVDAAGTTATLLSLQVDSTTPETFMYVGAEGGIQATLRFNDAGDNTAGAISYILGQKAGKSTANGGYASGALVLATQDGSAAVSGVTNGGNGESLYIYPGAGGAGFGGGTVGATGNIFLAWDDLGSAAQGNVAIGTNDLDGTPAIGRLVVRGSTNDGSTNIFVGRDSDGVNMASIDSNGNLVMAASARFAAIGSGASAGALHYTTDGTLTTNTSDVRLKENIVDLSNSLDKVLKLRSVNFTWKSDPGLGMRVGFIAQEMEQVFPEIVFTNPVDGFMGINYESLIPILVKAIQQQQVQLDSLRFGRSSVTIGTDLTSGGALEITGQLAFGVDTVGQAIIQTNDNRVTITFEQPYGYLPVVTATPISLFGGQYAIENVTFVGFDIVVKDPVMTDTTFGWHAFGAKNGKVYSSDGSVSDIELPKETASTPAASGGSSSAMVDSEVEEEPIITEEPVAPEEETTEETVVVEEPAAPEEETTEETVVVEEPAAPVEEAVPAEESATTVEATAETAPAADSSATAPDVI